MAITALASLGLAAAPSLLKGLGGLLQIGQGRRLARNNPFPTATVNENILKNAEMAENMGRVGLPQQQYNNTLNNYNRNLAGGLRTLSRSANPSAGVASLLRASNDATNNLDAQDAMARMQNQRFAFGQRSALANEQNRVFDWNKKQRYIYNGQAAAQALNAGRSNAFGSLTDLSMLGQSYFSGQNPNNTNKM